jgi:hypothetical protein
MEPKSLFLKREGFSPKNKVLDFLIVAQDFDYSLHDIAKHAGISYPCMKQLKKDLVKNKWIVMTRMVGRAQMYKLNLNSKKVSKFIEFYWSVIEAETDPAPKSDYTSSVRTGVSVSAKNL